MLKHERAKVMRAEGRTFAEIGAELGCTKQAAQQMVARAPRDPQAAERRGRPRTVFDTQRCYKCRETLPLGDFTTAPSRLSGRATICKKCNAIVNRERGWAKLSIEQLEDQNRKELDLIRLREAHIKNRKRT